jgi:hypothetical protein
MPTAILELHITDLRRQPIPGQVRVELRRDPGVLGAGGGNFDFTATLTDETILPLTDIPTRGGTGTLYRISVTAPGYLRSSFQQFLTDGTGSALQPVYLVRNPKRVASIAAPSFSALPAGLQAWLDSAQMIAPLKEDRDLLELSGQALYNALGDERRAGILNIYAKATHLDTVGPVFPCFGAPMVIRRDRCFARLSEEILERVTNDDRYLSAGKSLHDPLPGYRLSNSVKSDDPHANIQFTFQRSTADGSLAADIDIDEHSGFEHWGEVLRNHFTRQRTNPYAVHQLLLAANLSARHWDFPLEPGYDLIPKI